MTNKTEKVETSNQRNIKKQSTMRKSFICLFSILILCQALKAQNSPEISPVWNKYYNEHPSRIEENFQATDFLKVAEKFGFKPTRQEFKNNYKLFEMAMLRLPFSALEQFKIHGLYYSRTYKHDDWYYIYNSYYKKIAKSDWDIWCPYLIPLMSSDGTITLR